MDPIDTLTLFFLPTLRIVNTKEIQVDKHVVAFPDEFPLCWHHTNLIMTALSLSY